MSRDRLTKLLGMLGSDFDGERANAARMIAEMAKKEGKGVADYVMGGGGPQVIYRDRIVEKPVYRDRPCAECERRAKADRHDTRMYTEDDLRNYRPKERFNFENLRRPGQRQSRPKGEASIIAGLREAQDFPEHLSGWEMEFVEDILRKHQFDYELTDRQTKTARKIIAKIAAAEDGESLI